MLINYSTARDKFSSCKDGPGKEKSSQVITVPDTPCLPPNPGQSKGPGFHFVAFSNERLSAFILFGNVVAAKAASLRTIFFLLLLNLLGWHWLIKLYRFQVYKSIPQHLYIVLCVTYCHCLSCLLASTSLHPGSPLGITTLLSVSMDLGVCLFLTPSPFSPSSATPLPSTSSQFVHCACDSLLSLVYFDH